MANIIPMAGIGSRFSEAGYLLPKALIPVSGKPMITRVIEALPPAEKNIFIVRQEHINQYGIDMLIKQLLPQAIVIPVEKTTEGQACTTMLAMPYLEPNDEMFIAACDNSFVYNRKRYAQLTADSTIDAIIWTFTQEKLLVQKPTAWGWVKLASDGLTIDDMSVKVPVSDNPFNDHAVVATFYFKKASDFKVAYDLMIQDNYRINNEFYVDAMPIFYKKLDKRSVMFDVDLYVGWGKPQDLYEYQLWEYVCEHNRPAPDAAKLPLWRQFFKQLK
ncbi:MAG: NTP transferase domain-containing protein [Patescibacteria group bacterium]|jgi:dTDP-glucose pyrophosphorylase